jgi:hypothetical protein
MPFGLLRILEGFFFGTSECVVIEYDMFSHEVNSCLSEGCRSVGHLLVQLNLVAQTGPRDILGVCIFLSVSYLFTCMMQEKCVKFRQLE